MVMRTLFFNLTDIYREMCCYVFNILDLTSQDSLLNCHIHVAQGSPEYQNQKIQNN